MGKYNTNKRSVPRLILIGQKFGKLTVTEQEDDRHGKTHWLCHCECGGQTISSTNNLRSGRTNSCGCGRAETMADKMKAEMIGRKFGRLTVDSWNSKGKWNYYYWNCTCDCGSKVVTTTNELRMLHTRSCGCILKEMVGENHPRYNPDISTEERMYGRYELYGNNIIRWRKQVYERDEYTCQVCGNGQCHSLNAHHLDSWHWYEEGRFDVNNGVTLCSNCHKEFHSIYGYRDNNFFQFSQFQTSKTLTV